MSTIAYAIITLGNATLTGVMSGWLIYFYLPPGNSPLVPPLLFGFTMLISRVSHVTANILANRLAHKTSHKLWLILGGALFMPALFSLLWLPQGNNLLHLFFILVAFNIASGVHQAGYESILPALTPGEKERGAISTARMIFLLLGNILAGLAGPLIQQTSYPQAIGMFALGSAPFLIIPGFLLMHRFVGENLPLQRIPFTENVRTAWGSRAFRVFASSWALMWLATTFTFETIPYIVSEICRLSKAEAAYFYITPLLVSLIAYPAISRLTKRYGVKNVYRASLLTGAVAMSGLMLVGPSLPIPLLAQGILWIALQSICLIGAQALPGEIIAEITAHDPAQQGPLYAFGNLIDQLSSGLALAIIPFFLLFGDSHTDALGPLGVRLLAPTGGIFLLIAFFIFGQYKMDKIN